MVDSTDLGGDVDLSRVQGCFERKEEEWCWQCYANTPEANPAKRGPGWSGD